MKTFYIDLSTFGLEVVAPTMTDALALVRAFRLGARLRYLDLPEPARVSEKPTRGNTYLSMDMTNTIRELVDEAIVNEEKQSHVHD